MLIQNAIHSAIFSFSRIINLDTSTLNIYIDNNEYAEYIALQCDNSIRFNLFRIVDYIYNTKHLKTDDEVRAYVLRIVGHELCHINQLMVGDIEADCDIHVIKLIELNKRYFIDNYGYIDTSQFSDMSYIVDNYKTRV